MRNRTLVILTAVLTLSLLGNVVFWGWYASTPVTGQTALKSVTVNDIKFNALVVTYVSTDDKGTQKLQARMDYEYLQADGSSLKNASSEMVLSSGDISTLTNFINTKMGVIRNQEIASPGKLYTTPISVEPSPK
jgi:hypothetical protein